MIEFQDGPSRGCGPAHLYPALATQISGLEPSESAGDGPDLAGAAHGDTLQYFHKCLTNSFRRQWNILESIGDKDSLNNKIIVVLFTIKLTVHSPPHCLHLYLALQACRRRTSHHQLCCHHWGCVIRKDHHDWAMQQVTRRQIQFGGWAGVPMLPVSRGHVRLACKWRGAMHAPLAAAQHWLLTADRGWGVAHGPAQKAGLHQPLAPDTGKVTGWHSHQPPAAALANFVAC